MRLVRLDANTSTFRTVKFNPSGLTLIIGKQKTKNEPGKTYNGVGKSLAIALVHFCLGSNKKESFEEAIPNWEFELVFDLGDRQHSVRRNTSSQGKLEFDEEEFTPRKFCDHIEQDVFAIPSQTKGLSFRSLLSKFIRPRKGSYVSFDKANDKEKSEYLTLLGNAFLLGLDIDLVTNKYKLRTEKEAVSDFQQNLSKDSIFKEFFTGDRNVDIELLDLDERANQLDAQLAAFKVADNYQAVQRAAEKTRALLEEEKNKLFLVEHSIENIEKSLELHPDIPADSVIKIYKEAKIAFPKAVIKDLKAVSSFHEKLLKNRFQRLTKEKNRLEKVAETLRKNIISLAKKRDAELNFLGSHGALEDLLAMTRVLGDLRGKAQKIRDYKELLQKYSDQVQELTIAMSNQTKKANNYLRHAESVLSENLNRFRSFSRRFYPDKPGGLTVKNNEGDNQIRFEIEAKIEDDASDGINEVKIFCFDMTLLIGQHNHNVKFLFHDSRLFSNMDPRQRATLFKLVHEYSTGRGLQYIATLNEDQILSMKSQFNDKEFKEVITDNIVLELTDDSPAGKLLGIEVDMQYE